MTLGDLNLPISYRDAKQLALLFTPQLASRLAELHAMHGTQKCVPEPSTLSDGRLMLCADVLTEVEPGGMLHQMWEAADRSILNSQVEVIPWESAVSMLPKKPNPFA